MEEMKNGMNASNENNIAGDLNEVTTEIATRRKMCVVAIYTHRDML